MQKIARGTGYALLAAAAWAVATPSRADDKAKPEEAYLKASQPGPQHKVLASLAGSWAFTAKLWMVPGQPPQEWGGTAERKMILGGRFLRDEVSGQIHGMQFQGFGLTGYDNVERKFVGAWSDNMSTGMSRSVGTADAAGKVLTFHHEDFDPMEGKKVKSRDVIRILGDDKFVMEFYKPGPDGKEFKMMEINYTRKAAK